MSTDLQIEVWDAVCGRLRQRFGEGPYARWLRDLSPSVSSDDGSWVVLSARSELAAQVIKRRYLSEITSCFRDVSGRDVRLEVIASGEPSAPSVAATELSEGEDPQPSPAPASEPPARGREKKGEPESSAEPSLVDLVIGPSNRMACCAVVDVLEQPGKIYNPLFVYGPTGTGKTHLLRALAREYRDGGRARRRGSASGRPAPARAGAASSDPSKAWRIDWPREFAVPEGLSVRYVTADRFFHHFVASVKDGTLRKFHDVYRKADVLLIDDFHLLATKTKTLEEFLQTFNALVDAGKQVVITSALSPRELRGLSGSLLGRLLSGLVVRLGRPGYDMRLEILRSRAERFSTALPEDVLGFLAENVRGSARELIGALTQLEVHGRIDPDGINVELARAVLAERVRDQERRIRMPAIHAAVATHYGVSLETITGRSRQAVAIRARQVAIYLSRTLTRQSFASIGAYFGGRSHSTIQGAVQHIDRLAALRDNSVPWDLRAIRERLEDAG